MQEYQDSIDHQDQQTQQLIKDIVTQNHSILQESDQQKEDSQQFKVEKTELSSCSFDNDLWDSLPIISQNCKKGNQMLQSFANFCKIYNKLLLQFSSGLQKAADQFEKDLLTGKNFDTTAIAITNIRQAMDAIALQMQDKSNTIIGDLIEPLEHFQRHNQQQSNEQISQAKTYWHSYEEDKRRVIQIKDRYYKLMSEVEQSEISIELALLEHERGNISLEQVQRITNQTLNVKYKAELASQEYKKELDYQNSHLQKFDTEYRPFLQKLQQLEEARITFLKCNFDKFLRHQGSIGKCIVDRSSECQAQCSMINSDTDIKILIDENKTYQSIPLKHDFQAYEHSSQVLAQKADLINQINQQKLQNNLEQLDQQIRDQEMDSQELFGYFHSLIRGVDISFDQKSLIISSLHSSKTRDSVSEFLKSITSPKVIENSEAMKTMGDLLKYMLTAYVHEKDDNYKVLYAILHCSQLVFCIREGDNNEKQKVYLTSYLSDHGIWQEQSVWKVCIQKIINQKFHEAIQSPSAVQSKQQRLQQQQEQQNNQQSSGGLFGQLGKLKGFWGQQSHKNEDNHSSNNSQEKQNPLRIPKSLAQNIIFNSLSKFLYHFVNFQLAFETSRDVLLFFCNKYELDHNRTHLLLSELESIQKKTRFTITEKEVREMSMLKKIYREEQFGNDYLIILAMSIKYIDSDQTIRNLLVLNKKTKAKISDKVYKQALLHSQPDRLKFKRIKIWEILLKINSNQRDYYAFRDKVIQSESSLISNVEEVINMDVQRSFTRTKVIDPVVLTNILKTYAFFNPEIEYCQGMNFVAGFLFLVFRDEVKSFRALQDIVEQHDMADLFNTDLPKLKLFFYQFDRLLNILMPQLHSHFKDEMVNASYYTSPWFITIFTQSLQNQEGEFVSDKLLELWDYFLTSGWKAIFKMGLYVIKENEQDLTSMSFEQILNYVSEKPKQMLSEYVTPGSGDMVLYQELKRSLKGTKHLGFILNRLEKEFKESLEAAMIIKSQQQRSPNKQRNQIQQV